MTIGEKLLKKVHRQAPFRDRIEQVFADEGNLRVRCEMSEADRLGCALMHLEIVKEQRPGLATDELARRLEGLCGKITYLLEPLRTVEVDRHAQSVLVRSKEPRRKRQEISYYELIADESLHLSLRRYCYDLAERKRQPVPFVLSDDQLEMLLDDLQNTVADASAN